MNKVQDLMKECTEAHHEGDTAREARARELLLAALSEESEDAEAPSIEEAIEECERELARLYPNHCPDCEGRGGKEEDNGGRYPDWVTCHHCVWAGLDPLDVSRELLPPPGAPAGFDPAEVVCDFKLRECISPTTGSPVDYGFHKPSYRLSQLRNLRREVAALEQRRAALAKEIRELLS